MCMLMEQCKAWRLGTCAVHLLWPPSLPPGGQAGPGEEVGRVRLGCAHSKVAIQFSGCSARGILRLSGGSLPPISYPGTPGTLVQGLQYTWPLFISCGLGQWGCGRGRCQVGLLCSQLGHSLWVL